MGLNDKRKIIEGIVENKETFPARLAKLTWDEVCYCFNNPEVSKHCFVEEDVVEVDIVFDFTYRKEIDGNEVEMECREVLEGIKKYCPNEYDYFKPALTGGVDAKVIEMVPKALFKSGHATWSIKKTKLLEDVEKELYKIAKEEGAEIDIRYCDGGFSSLFKTSNDFSETFEEPLISRGDEPNYKFSATIRVRRL